MWTFEQTGDLKHNGTFVSKGYSGHGAGENNPAFQSIHDIGPIPQGLWLICGPPHDSETHGPYVMSLSPSPKTNTFGRSGFLIHGDSKLHPGQASLGCIILPRAIREQIWNSGDRDLEVVA